MTRIQNIIFDLGGVVFTDGTQQFIDYLLHHYPHLNPKQLNQLIRTGPLADAYRTGQISRQQFWQTIIRNLKLNVTFTQLENQWISYYKPQPLVFKLLQTLKKAGYKLHYLSDNVKERADKLDQKYRFKSLFDGGLFSYQVGIRKPDPKIYQVFLQTYNLDPLTCLFIDDKEKNLTPAKNLGMNTLLFTNYHQLTSSLQKLNLLQT